MFVRPVVTERNVLIGVAIIVLKKVTYVILRLGSACMVAELYGGEQDVETHVHRVAQDSVTGTVADAKIAFQVDMEQKTAVMTAILTVEILSVT